MTPGNSFSYTIQIPDPAQVSLLGCDLTGVGATDTISDIVGEPTFTVTSVDNGGTVTATSSHSATVSWSGLTYKAGASPLQLHINVLVPTDRRPDHPGHRGGHGNHGELSQRASGRRRQRHRLGGTSPSPRWP